jgi:hypothetical protein
MPDSFDPTVHEHDPAPNSPLPAASGAHGGSRAGPVTAPVREIGGRKDGTDPTRYGDWEKNGRCIDF